MNYAGRLEALAHRKAALSERIARERDGLAVQIIAWQRPIDIVNRGIGAARFLKAHPALVAAAIGAAAVLGRRSLLRWAGRGLLVWRTWRALRVWMRALSS